MKKKILNIGLILLINILFICSIKAETYDNFNSDLLSCGRGLIENIPAAVPKVVSLIYTIIQIAVPVVLVVLGSLDMLKGVTAQKEDDIKKGQSIFIKRLISAALVFFVFIIVKLIVSFAADNSIKIMECAECFINGEKSCTVITTN